MFRSVGCCCCWCCLSTVTSGRREVLQAFQTQAHQCIWSAAAESCWDLRNLAPFFCPVPSDVDDSLLQLLLQLPQTLNSSNAADCSWHLCETVSYQFSHQLAAVSVRSVVHLFSLYSHFHFDLFDWPTSLRNTVWLLSFSILVNQSIAFGFNYLTNWFATAAFSALFTPTATPSLCALQDATFSFLKQHRQDFYLQLPGVCYIQIKQPCWTLLHLFSCGYIDCLSVCLNRCDRQSEGWAIVAVVAVLLCESVMR